MGFACRLTSSDLGISALPFKLNQDRRHHIPRQQHWVTNWPAYDAGLRQRGSLTVWFTDEAVAAWAAAPRTTQGGQPFYSPLAILTALTLRRLPSRLSPIQKANRLDHQSARPGVARARPHDTQPSLGNADRAAAAAQQPRRRRR